MISSHCETFQIMKRDGKLFQTRTVATRNARSLIIVRHVDRMIRVGCWCGHGSQASSGVKVGYSVEFVSKVQWGHTTD